MLAALAIAGLSCGGGPDAESGEPAAYEIDRVWDRGPVSFRVAVSRREVTIADHVTMLLETRAREGYEAQLPRFGEKLEQFGIVDYTTPKPELDETGAIVTSRIYELAPFLSGEYAIPPMTVTFHASGDSIMHTLESDTLRVSVLSILPEDQAELEIKDIVSPFGFPRNPYPALIIAGAVLLVAVLTVLYRRRRGRLAAARAEILPHELAYMRLQELLESGLLEEKRYREFTAAVADVLRGYIEDRFGLRAPERTTEEFLAEAGTGLPVGKDRRAILEEFLRHCDLVKFAALEPSSDDVSRSFETCRDFIDATKREEVKEAAA
jgi:hypothetical protein